MAITSPQQLLALKLRHIQDAETETARVLAEIRQQVDEPELLNALRQRQDESRMVLEAIQPLLPKLDGDGDGDGAGDPQNHAARGIIQEARTLLAEIEDPQLQQAVAIGSLQSLEHYCIATWGTVKALARQMGEEQVADVMQRALDSGKQLDARLTQIAESQVNPAAVDNAQQGGGASQGGQHAPGLSRPLSGLNALAASGG